MTSQLNIHSPESKHPSLGEALDTSLAVGASLFNKTMEEMWKDIKGYEGLYQISNLSRVLSIKSGIILRQTLDCGYCRVKLQHKRITKTVRVHRILAEAFIPNPDNKPQINHKNGIKHDNLLSNIEWCTGKENVVHAHKNGLCTKTILTESQINNLRKINSKKVIDIETKVIYQNAFIAAAIYGINKNTLRQYLLGYITNKTPLRYI